MNKLPHAKVDEADAMFASGASVREVMAKVKIARETAHRIQRMGRLADMATRGNTRVLTGKRADGSLSYYVTKELRPHWNGPRGTAADFGLRSNAERTGSAKESQI